MKEHYQLWETSGKLTMLCMKRELLMIHSIWQERRYKWYSERERVGQGQLQQGNLEMFTVLQIYSEIMKYNINKWT